MQLVAFAVASGLELEAAFAVVGLELQASAVRLPGLVQGLARVAALQAVATAAVREPGVLAAEQTAAAPVAWEVQTAAAEQQKQAGLRRLEQPPEQQGNPQHQQEQLVH